MSLVHPAHARPTYKSLNLIGASLLLPLVLWWLPTAPGAAGLAHYLPLHTALETVSIVIAALIFAIAWLTPGHALAANVQILAFAFLGVAVLDFTHLLSYRGMPDFVTPSSPEKAIDFWLAARLLAALGLLVAVVLPWRVRAPFRPWMLPLAVAAYVLGVHLLVLPRHEWLPRTFIDGQGLTSFKIGFEFLLVLLFAASAAILMWRMRRQCPFNAPALLGAAGLMAASELFFTLYKQVTDVYNLTGHVYKIGAYYLLYRALVVDAVRQPYSDLQQSRQALAETSARLADQRHRLECILAGTQAGTWEWNVQTGQTRFNERWAEMLGYRLDALQPTSIDTWIRLTHPEDLVRAKEALQRHLNGEAPYYEAEMRMQHKDGHWIWVHDRGQLYSRTAAGEPEWMFGTHLDITAQREHFDALANHDALTGLPNRRLLDDRLQQALADAQRNDSELVVCMLDLDGFKAVNDSAGHAEGDRLLVEVARRMQHTLRAGETLARLGGDEFVLILRTADCQPALERVLEVVREPVALASNLHTRVTASIGASLYRPGVLDGTQLLREADQALYQAKQRGKNVCVMFKPGSDLLCA